MLILTTLLLVYASAGLVASERIYIVTSSVENCPQDLDIDRCLTLQHYASNLTFSTLNIRQNLSLEMEPGSHSLDSPISLVGRQNNSLVFKAVNGTADVVCNRQLVESFYIQGRLSAGNFHRVQISGVNFIGCDQNGVYSTTKTLIEDVHYRRSRLIALILTDVTNARIINSSISDLVCLQPSGFCSVQALMVSRSSLHVDMCTFFDTPPNTVGGGITIDNSDMVIENSSFRNISGGTGGAIRITNSRNRKLAITNSTFYGNKASRNGGAIYINSSDITIKSCEFINNIANAGGAVLATGINISLIVAHSIFRNNTARGIGGAVVITDGIITLPDIADALYPNTRSSLAITASKFENNQGQSGGGAVAVFGRRSEFSLYKSSFLNNTAFRSDRTGRGGALRISSPHSYTLIEESEFIRNEADKEGGSIDIGSQFCQVFVRMSTFTENIAHFESGGAIAYLQARDNNITIDKSTFNRNSASFCGALDVVQATIRSSIFTENRAIPVPRSSRNWKTVGGGAICVRENTTEVAHSTFQRNIAINSGAGVINTFSGLRIENSTFDRNMAGKGGGVIHQHSGNLSIIQSNFSNNQATGSGGVAHGVSVRIENVNFVNNTASDGGSLYILQAVINNSNFVHNQASSDGGAVFFYRCLFCGKKESFIALSNFTNNGARQGVGGGIVLNRHNLSLIKNIFSHNFASSCGVIKASSYKMSISRNTFTWNSATGVNSERVGGGVMCLRSGSVLVNDGEFIHNTAIQHGGVMEVDNSTVLIEGSLFDNNTARDHGGVAYTSSFHSPSTFEVVDSSFFSNQALRGDGGVFYLHSEGSKIDVNENNFSHNRAGHYGGLFSVDWTSLTVNDTNIFNNTATKGNIVSTCNGNITILTSGTYNISKRQADNCFFYDMILQPSATLSPMYSTVLASSIAPSDVTFSINKGTSTTATYHLPTSRILSSSFIGTYLDLTATVATTSSYKTKTRSTETVVTRSTLHPGISVTDTLPITRSTLHPGIVVTNMLPTNLPPTTASINTHGDVSATTNDGMKLCAHVTLLFTALFALITLV